MALTEVIDEHVLSSYRRLLDAEDAAFDELEHACEEGDRAHFTQDLAAWQEALSRKFAFLRRLGLLPADEAVAAT
ncbi:MAG TPA: hypothetical protein VFP54_05095 [Acidimicrobiales bacterium]|nr:hypothetical protein [Acidimicrobiales bacterium]